MRKVCKNDKLFVEGGQCPVCKGSSFTDNWKGRLYILDSDKSEVAQKIGIKQKGEYAIKVR